MPALGRDVSLLAADLPPSREVGGIHAFGLQVSGKFTLAGRGSRIAEPAALGRPYTSVCSEISGAVQSHDETFASPEFCCS